MNTSSHTATTARFKIDVSEHSLWPFGLYHRRPCWHHFITGLVWWDRIAMYETKEQTMTYYNLIKDLPEYLS